VTGGPNMSLFEVNEAAAIIKETSHPDVNLIFGAVIDDNMGDEIRITVIATGFEQSRVTTRRPVKAATASPRDRVTTPAVPAARPVMRPAQPPPDAPAKEEDDQAAPPQAQVRKVEEEFTSRVYDTDDLDIPAFLRRR
jgi:cell division protein FtsZ